MRGLRGKRALVTGASGGIGRAVSLRLAEEGCFIFINGRDVNKLNSLYNEIKERGGDSMTLPFDIANGEEVKSAFKHIKENGGIDFLVNNAGITRDNLFVTMKEEEWDEVIKINLKGTYYCTKEAVRMMMKKGGGRIVNIVSVAGESGNPGQANYSATKGGLIAFTKSLAKELAPKNILVNAVSPGFIETEMTRNLPEELKSKILQNIPLKRFGTPEDVAGVVAFLLSEDASYITGEVIRVNGGLYM